MFQPGGVGVLVSFWRATVNEYQAVILRLTRHAQDDEDALTDLLNERSRGGWRPCLITQDESRMTLVFERDALADGIVSTGEG